MEAALLAGCGLLGILFGSFANVVIARVPAGQSTVSPASRCPSCGNPLRAIDNVPLLSWVLLRGRCRSCGAPISVQYPLVELAGGVLFAAMAWRFGLTWVLPAYLLFAWTLLVVAVIDARTRKIPNRLTYPLTPALAVLIVAGALLESQPFGAVRALAGAVAAFAFLFLLALISPRGMGLGDVKLAAFIGLGLGYLGWGHVVIGVFGAFLLGGVAAIALMAVRRRTRKDQIAFGPSMAVAAVVAVLFGHGLIDAYLRSAGLA